MADQYVQLPADSTGKKLRMRQIVVGADTVQQQVGTLANGAGDLIGGDVANGLDVDVTRLPALPAGTNNIGDVDIASIAAGDNNIGNVDIASIAAGDNNIGNVDVVSLPALPAGTNNIGDVDIVTMPTVTVQDGGNILSVDDGAGSLTVDSTQFPAALTGSGNFKVAIQEGSAAGTEYTEGDTDASISGGAVMWEDGSDTLRAVSAAKPLPVNVVTGGTSGVQYTEGDTDATVTGTAVLWEDGSDTMRVASAAKPLPVNVVAGAAGGTQYTEGDTDTTITGTAAMMEVAANVLQPVQGTVADGLLVNLGGNNDVTVTGSVTANAGTNLNTSALALEATLGSVKTAVEKIDDAIAGSEMQVDVLTSALPTGAASLAEQQTQTTALQLIDDLPHSGDAALSKYAVIGAQFDDTGTGTVTENNAHALRMTSGRALHTSVRDALPAGTNNIGDVDVLTLPALPAGTNNIGDVDIASALPAGTNNIGDVDIASAIPAGTNNIGDVDIVTMPNVTLAAGTNTNEVVGDVAEDIAAAGNPVQVGWRASTAIPAAMSADGDVVRPWANRSGAAVMVQAPHVGLNSDPWALVHKAAQYTTTQTSAVLVAGGASEKIVVTKVQIQVGGTTAGTLQIYFGTGAYSRGTSRAIFDGEFAPSATLKPGVVMDGPFISGANGDDVLVTTSAAINPLTISIWYYVVT